MTKFSGYESSVLAYIAMFPGSGEAEAKAETLTGEAREIADALLDKADEAHRTPESSEAAQAMRKWASAAAHER